MAAVTIPESDVHELHSQNVWERYQIWVARPVRGFREFTGPPIAFYVLDANLFFGTAVEMSRLMHRLYGEIPPVLVFGVAYPTEDFFLQGELRTRDFTPTRDRTPPPRLAGFKPTLPPDRAMGGADPFLAFLHGEVHPFVRNRYEVAPGEDVLFGSSLGGLFATHALLTKPESFARYIIASPALWWDEERRFETEGAYARRASDVGAHVFLTAGALEEDPRVPFLAKFKMVTNVHRMAESLASRRYPSLELKTHIFEGETHTSVVAAAITRGLRALLRLPQRT